MRPHLCRDELGGDTLHLIAAEWLMPLAMGVKAHPSLVGQPFNGPLERDTPLMPAEVHHDALSEWPVMPNPAGLCIPSPPRSSARRPALWGSSAHPCCGTASVTRTLTGQVPQAGGEPGACPIRVKAARVRDDS
jgi:hypothetical protein